jgi:Flp pilus assembly secretin CpaC
MKALKAAGRHIVMSAGAVALIMAMSMPSARAEASDVNETLAIVLDQSRIVKVPERTATIVVGNPLIADASVQPGGLMVLTGKGFGRTSLIALDGSGNKLLETNLLVRGPADTVTVYRGIQRETYSCEPECEPRNTPGDSQLFFTQSLNRIVTRNNQARAVR